MKPDCSDRNVISAAMSSSSQCFALGGKVTPTPPPNPPSSQRGKWEIYFGQIAKTILQKREAIQPQSKAIEACNKFPTALVCSPPLFPQEAVEEIKFLGQIFSLLKICWCCLIAVMQGRRRIILARLRERPSALVESGEGPPSWNESPAVNNLP